MAHLDEFRHHFMNAGYHAIYMSKNLAQVHNLKWAHFIAGISDFLVLPIGRKRDGYLYIGFHIGLRFCSIPELGAGMPRFMMVELSAVLLTGCVSTLSLRSSHEFFEAFMDLPATAFQPLWRL